MTYNFVKFSVLLHVSGGSRTNAAWPALMQANALLRQAVGRVRSVDMLQWDGVAYGEHPRQRMHYWELNDLAPP